ncbi:MAG: o-succinylbenzoate synthase [Bacteroidales bacterium]
MLKVEIIPYQLHFKEPGGTSRGVMYDRQVWYFKVYDPKNPTLFGMGECAPLPGLSCDPLSDFPDLFRSMEEDLLPFLENQDLLKAYPSVVFALEMAILDLTQGGREIWFPSQFTQGEDSIRINGLIWMGSEEEMLRRIGEKLDSGFSCLKLKIGAIDFDSELQLLKNLRAHFSERELELRVDANGAFTYEDAFGKLERLAVFGLHSIEQPIRAGHWEQMAELCLKTPVPIALDEELIGVNDRKEKERLLDVIHPQYIILKPSLVGGFRASDEWITLAEARNTGWWITSALESNLGLNAIAQWCYTKHSSLPQGLGTGQLFTNNLPSSLHLKGEFLSLSSENKPSVTFKVE